MSFKYKNILVFGLGLSGVSSLKALKGHEGNLLMLDSREKALLRDSLKELDGILTRDFLGGAEPPLSDIDLIVKSPGIPPHNSFLQKAKNKNIPIISDLELSYLLSKANNIIGITGTNGKTSTTLLLGEMLKTEFKNIHLAGNIGIATPELMSKSIPEDIFVLECSSFQLNGISSFKPKIGILINLKEDHLDWHKTMDNYIHSKLKMFSNQDSLDYAILNYDDELIRKYSNQINSNIIWISKNPLDKGVYIENDEIIININNKKINIGSSKNINIIIDNALVAIAAAIIMGISLDNIKKVLHSFNSLEHRLEYVKTIKNIEFYNDSKGTNPDSTIMALKHLKDNVILIAGGFDKKSHYEELSLEIENRVKHLILMGDTKEKIKTSVQKTGFTNIHLVNNMLEAVNLAYDLSEPGNKVLLSPACASWGLYKNFEERGLDFKNKVNNIQVSKNEKN